MDEVIKRLERKLWPSDDAIVIVKCGDLRELLELARKSLDRIKDQSHGG